MENRRNWLGILVLVFGMMVVGCDNGTTENNNVPNEKTLTINGIGVSGNVTILLNTTGGPESPIVAWAASTNVNSGNNVTFTLKQINSNASNFQGYFTNLNWNKNGTYSVMLYEMTPEQLSEILPAPNCIAYSQNFSEDLTIIEWSIFIPVGG